MKLLDTIAAISTHYGKGGVAMIRISGTDAVAVGERVFSPACGVPLSRLAHGKMVYGLISTPDGQELDDGMAVVFRGPHSFTGEDTVELTCHGGVLITSKVLQAVLCAGARAAEAGEFTRRAYVSGRMRLSQAEALGNLLEAKSVSQLMLARNGMRGGLADRTEGIYQSLLDMMTSVYAAIDFPDEDLAELSRQQLCDGVSSVLSDIRALAATYGTGRAINEGIPTVICGRTNAGKSSVYNRILGYDAAIVTDVEGTTRDVLRETAVLGKTLLLLCDTAGLRQTEDQVERIGIERTRAALRGAGLILAVFDLSRPLTEEDLVLAREVSQMGVPSVALLNKCDLGDSFDASALREFFGHCVSVSAVDGRGFDKLASVIDEFFIDGSLDVSQDAVVTGARQFAALNTASEALEFALTDLRLGVPLDLCCVAMESALTSLGEVDGRELGEEIVAEIFSRFCVGK